MPDSLPNQTCNGCNGCRRKCAGEIPMTADEFRQIRKFLRDTRQAALALQAAREVRGSSDPCGFLELSSGMCRIYPVRPFVCRLFGLTEFFPCPLNLFPPKVSDGWQRLQAYAQHARHSFRDWSRLLAE